MTDRTCIVKGCTNPATGLQCGRDDCARHTDPTSAPPPTAPTATHDEATEQATGLAWLQAHGWHTWRIGQRDARGTQDPGVPDVVAIHPDHGLTWWEVKGQGGRPSKEQKVFGSVCRQAGVRWVCGGAATMQAVVEAIMGERGAA